MTNPYGTVRSTHIRSASLALAAEGGRAYDAGEPVEAQRIRDPLTALPRVVAALQERSVDEYDDEALGRELEVVERAARQLQARQSRLAAAVTSRAAARARISARAAGRAPDAAAANATRRTRRELADQLGWSPAQAKRAADLGDRLDPSAAAGRAFDEGSLSSRHAAVLTDTLRWIEEPGARAEAEATLLGLAAEQDPVEFGRSCRRLLAELDPTGAEEAAQRRRARQTASVWQTEDGMVGASSRLAGADGELFATAFHAFRRPDAPGEHRTTERANADALVAMARAALDAGVAPTRHGVRPHITVLLDWQTVATGSGVAEGAWSGPLTAGEVRRLLADCGVSRLVLDPKGVPLEAGEAVRTVPAGLYRILLARDGGCIAKGCDVPAAWCQVMHLTIPYRFGGRLSPETAALGCPYHHDALDRRGWTVSWEGRRPVLSPPAGSPSRRTNDGPLGERMARAGSAAGRPRTPRPAAVPDGSVAAEASAGEAPSLTLLDPVEGCHVPSLHPREARGP